MLFYKHLTAFEKISQQPENDGFIDLPFNFFIYW